MADRLSTSLYEALAGGALFDSLLSVLLHNALECKVRCGFSCTGSVALGKGVC